MACAPGEVGAGGSIVKRQAPTQLQREEAIREELAEYVAFRERLGQPITFVKALSGVRDATRVAYLIDGDTSFRDRLEALNAICIAEGIG